MKIAVIVPTWNREKNIERTVKCLLWQDVSIQHEMKIYVVDDHSTDRTREVLKKYPITILETPQHTVWNAAVPRNTGAKATPVDTDLLYFIDSDVMLPPNRVQRAIDIYEADPDPNRVIIGPYHFMQTILDPQNSKWYEKSITDYSGDIRWRMFEEHEPHEKHTGLEWALACFGGNLIIPRMLFFRAGGFDEEMLSGVEDGDFGLTLWEAGAVFSADRGLLGWHNHHEIHPERTKFIKEGVAKINEKHNVDIIKLTGETYRKWGIGEWKPPKSWVDESGYTEDQLYD